MKIGSMYKHDNNTDVAIVVLHRAAYEKGVAELKVIWFNIVNSDNKFAMVKDKINIRFDDLHKWKEILE